MPFVPVTKKDLEQPLAEPGSYPCRIEGVKLRESAAKNQVLNLRWVIMGSEPPAGISILDGVTLIPEAYWKLNQLFQAVHYEVGEDGFNTEELVGREARLVVTHKTGDDNVTRAQVTQYLPL